MIDRVFITGGNATFTVEPAQADRDRLGLNPHYTYRVNKPKPKREGDRPPFFVSVLTGPDNQCDYTYLGILDKERGQVYTTRNSGFREDSWQARIINRVVAAIWAGRAHEIEACGWTVQHCGHCCRCGHKLTVPASIETGIGPECETLVLAGFVHLDEVPQVDYPEIARLQASYWMQAQPDIFGPMRDACLDAGLTEERADQLTEATKYTMRKFKKGKNWPKAFKRIVEAATAS